jgi:hypothetical protein
MIRKWGLTLAVVIVSLAIGNTPLLAAQDELEDDVFDEAEATENLSSIISKTIQKEEAEAAETGHENEKHDEAPENETEDDIFFGGEVKKEQSTFERKAPTEVAEGGETISVGTYVEEHVTEVPESHISSVVDEGEAESHQYTEELSKETNSDDEPEKAAEDSSVEAKENENAIKNKEEREEKSWRTARVLMFAIGAACLIGAGLIVRELLRKRSE